LLDFFVWGLRGLEITFDSHPQPGADRSSERLVDITLHNRLTTDKCNRSHGAASKLFISVWKLHYIKAFLWPSQPAQRNRNPNPLKWMAPNKLWQPCQYVNCFVVVARSYTHDFPKNLLLGSVDSVICRWSSSSSESVVFLIGFLFFCDWIALVSSTLSLLMAIYELCKFMEIVLDQI